MHTLLVYIREARAQIVSTWRTPQFIIPSVALPLLFYLVEGSGLKGMRARLAAIGGALDIKSGKTETRLVATAPLETAS